MKKIIYFLFIIISIVNFNCSNDEQNDNETPRNTIPFKITFTGEVDGNFSGSPESKNIKAITFADDLEETVIHESFVQNGFTMSKFSEIDAENIVGIKLSCASEDTSMNSILVKIENLETSEVLVQELLNKSIVDSSPGINSTLEIVVSYNITTDTTTIID